MQGCFCTIKRDISEAMRRSEGRSILKNENEMNTLSFSLCVV